MKRLKKTLQCTGIALVGLVAVGLIANAVFVWITDARLERQLAAIRAAGDPVTLAELAPKPIPPEKNANTYLRKAEADVMAIEKDVEELPDFLLLYSDEKQPTPEKMQKAIRAIYAMHPKAVELLQHAADCPDYDSQLDYSLSIKEFVTQLISMIGRFRSDVRVLAYRSRLLEIDGDTNGS